MLVHKIHPNKFKKIEIISSIFSKHNGMKLEINNRRRVGTFTKMWKLNNTLLNNQWVIEVIKREILKRSSDNQKWKYNIPNLWDAAKAVLRQKFSDKRLH